MKGNHSYSILQGKGKRCYLSGNEHQPLHRHHVYFGTGQRAISDKHGFWVWLRPEWHNTTNYGVHGKMGHKLDLMIKEDCQRKYEEEWLKEHEGASEIEARMAFMNIIGRNYLSDSPKTAGVARRSDSADPGIAETEKEQAFWLVELEGENEERDIYF